LAGWADVLSAIFRSTIIQLAAPDDLRGRLMGVQTAAVIAGPRLGDMEAGAVANALGATTSVVSGGLACIVGALALARLLPAFFRQEAPAPQDAAERAAAGPEVDALEPGSVQIGASEVSHATTSTAGA
jgi:hypothetical protein